MKNPKEPEIDVIDDPETKEDSEQQVVVDLEKPEKKQDEKNEQPKPEKPEEITKLHNTIAYQTRKLEQAMRELQELKTQLVSRSAAVQESSKDTDEIDDIAQRDWKLGVKKVVEKDIESKVQEILQKRDQAVQEIQRKSLLEAELEKSKQKVLAKYPTIEDDSTDEARLYREVINEDSSILSNIHGPEIAMYRMEEKMRQNGVTPPTVKPMVDREVNRLVRAGAGAVVGRQASPSGKIVLTRDQKEFCDHYKIPYEQYAKNLKAQEAGGVET